jgi:hypothetical protein
MSNYDPEPSFSALHTVFDLVATKLPALNVPCLLVGGFAVNHYGYSRSTLDIDFMIVSDDRDAVRDAMRQAGFTSHSIHTNVTFFQRPGETLRVDFLNTDSETMAKLLSHAARADFFGVSVRLPALRDLLAMKFFALSQALGRRTEKDVPDIAWLTLINGLDTEADLHPLALRFADEGIFRRVCEKMEEIQA